MSQEAFDSAMTSLTEMLHAVERDCRDYIVRRILTLGVDQMLSVNFAYEVQRRLLIDTQRDLHTGGFTFIPIPNATYPPETFAGGLWLPPSMEKFVQKAQSEGERN